MVKKQKNKKDDISKLLLHLRFLIVQRFLFHHVMIMYMIIGNSDSSILKGCLSSHSPPPSPLSSSLLPLPHHLGGHSVNYTIAIELSLVELLSKLR